MGNTAEHDNKELIRFWDQALALSKEEKESVGEVREEDLKEMAPAAKLYDAAASLGKQRRVLDYGCGNAWAGITAAKSGCRDVTAVDVSEGPIESASFYADLFKAGDGFRAFSVSTDWLGSVEDGAYDGIICSNVLDVVPAETAEAIIREMARIATDDASVIIGLNFYMTPDECAARGMEIADGNKVYVNGVLRLVLRSDDEWEQAFAPYFEVERLEHFAWQGEETEKRRLFFLKKK